MQMKSYQYAHRKGVEEITWERQVFIDGQWQPHPELVEALKQQNPGPREDK